MKEIVLTLYGVASKNYKINFEDDVADAIQNELKRFFGTKRDIEASALLRAFIELALDKYNQQRESTEKLSQKMSQFNEMFQSVKKGDESAALFVANKQNGDLVSADVAASEAQLAILDAQKESGALDLASLTQIAGVSIQNFSVTQGALSSVGAHSIHTEDYNFYKSKFYDNNGEAIKRSVVDSTILNAKEAEISPADKTQADGEEKKQEAQAQESEKAALEDSPAESTEKKEDEKPSDFAFRRRSKN